MDDGKSERLKYRDFLVNGEDQKQKEESRKKLDSLLTQFLEKGGVIKKVSAKDERIAPRTKSDWELFNKN
jgi:hypothetical protein